MSSHMVADMFIFNKNKGSISISSDVPIALAFMCILLSSVGHWLSSTFVWVFGMTEVNCLSDHVAPFSVLRPEIVLFLDFICICFVYDIIITGDFGGGILHYFLSISTSQKCFHTSCLVFTS